MERWMQALKETYLQMLEGKMVSYTDPKTGKQKYELLRSRDPFDDLEPDGKGGYRPKKRIKDDLENRLEIGPNGELRAAPEKPKPTPTPGDGSWRPGPLSIFLEPKPKPTPTPGEGSWRPGPLPIFPEPKPKPKPTPTPGDGSWGGSKPKPGTGAWGGPQPKKPKYGPDGNFIGFDDGTTPKPTSGY